MKRHIVFFIKSFMFIAILIPFVQFLSYMVKPNTIDLRNIAGFYSEEKNSLDMVYIGGSAAFVYYESLKAYEDRGLASYVYGANTMQAELYKYMIKDILKTQDPEVILIDARAFQYRDEDQPPTDIAYLNLFTGMRYSLNRFEAIEDTVKKYLNDETINYHFDIARYHSSAMEFDINTPIRRLFNKKVNELRGFCFIQKIAPIKRHYFETNNAKPMSPETVDILNDLLKYLKSTNKKYLFVVSPYEELKSHKENFNYLKNRVEEAGFNFIDTNDYIDEMKIDYNTDFYNNNHVNIYGAEKFTQFLTDYLYENYNFKDIRNDKNYSEWKKYLKRFKKCVKDTKAVIDKIRKEQYE